MNPVRRVAFVCAVAVFFLLPAKTLVAAPAGTATSVSLNAGWQLQSSCDVKATGEQVSAVGFDAKGWHKTTVPNTVVGSLVDDKTYPDPTYGTNLKNLPGMNYSSATFFALQDDTAQADTQATGQKDQRALDKIAQPRRLLDTRTGASTQVQLELTTIY